MFWQQIYGVLIYISTQYFCNEAKNDAKTRPERGQKIALETLSFSSSLPPARQQVSSRSLEAVWQQLKQQFARCPWWYPAAI